VGGPCPDGEAAASAVANVGSTMNEKALSRIVIPLDVFALLCVSWSELSAQLLRMTMDAFNEQDIVPALIQVWALHDLVQEMLQAIIEEVPPPCQFPQ
jgi:hypothetical protein